MTHPTHQQIPSYSSIRIEELITTLRQHRPDIQHEARWFASDAFYLRLAIQRKNEAQVEKIITQLVRNARKLGLWAEFQPDWRGLHVKLYDNTSGKCVLAH